MIPIDLSGKKAIITGACGGLGRAMAAGLVKASAEVLALDVAPNVHEIAGVIGAAHAIQANLLDRRALARGFEEAMEKLSGRVDILVNSAGIQRRHELEDFPIGDWDDVMEVNLNAVWQLCQLAGRVMLKQGSGKIINIASMLSFFGGFRIPAYAASKGGVMQLTRSLAVGWAGKGIQVNAIAPGYMDTEMNTALINDEKRNASILARIPAGRWGKPEDMIGPCLFLASGLSDYLSGAILPVDGGYMVC